MLTKHENNKNIVVFETITELLLAADFRSQRSSHSFGFNKFVEKTYPVDNIFFLGLNPFNTYFRVHETCLTDYVRSKFSDVQQIYPYELYTIEDMPNFSSLWLTRGSGQTIVLTFDGVEYNAKPFSTIECIAVTQHMLAANRELYKDYTYQLFVNHRTPSVHVPISVRFDADKLSQRIRPIIASIIKSAREVTKYLGYGQLIGKAIRTTTGRLINPITNVIIGAAANLDKTGTEKRKGLKLYTADNNSGSAQVASLLYGLAFAKMDAEAICNYLFEDWDTDQALSSKAKDIQFTPTAHFRNRFIFINAIRKDLLGRRRNLEDGDTIPMQVIRGKAETQFNNIVRSFSDNTDVRFKPSLRISDNDIIVKGSEYMRRWFKGICKLTDIIWKTMFDELPLLDKIRDMSLEELQQIPIEDHINDILVNFLPVRVRSAGVYNQINDYFSIFPSPSNSFSRRIVPDELVTSTNRDRANCNGSYAATDEYRAYLSELMSEGKHSLVTVYSTHLKVSCKLFDFAYSLLACRNSLMIDDKAAKALNNYNVEHLQRVSDTTMRDALYRGYLLPFVAATFALNPDAYTSYYADGYGDMGFMFTSQSYVSMKNYTNKNAKDRFTTSHGKFAMLDTSVIDTK